MSSSKFFDMYSSYSFTLRKLNGALLCSLRSLAYSTNASVSSHTYSTRAIEHDAIIGDHCHIATGAIINGEVSVGNETFIGSGAVTKQCISIGNNCIVSAGIVLKSDVEPNQLIKN